MANAAVVNPVDLTGRTVLVTGASSGIGRETSLLLSRLGARLVLVARNRERLDAVGATLAGDGHRIVACDLAEVDRIPEWLKGLAAETGPLAGVVHCAGLQISRPVRSLTNDELARMMTLNVAAALALAKGFRQKGVAAEGGSLVFLSSVMGLVGQPLQAGYSASKGALGALTKSLALELAREGIRVNCVAPGMVATEMSERLFAHMTDEQRQAIEGMHPLGLGRPEDVAHAIAFLLGGMARWITGTTLVVDGGYTAH